MKIEIGYAPQTPIGIFEALEEGASELQGTPCSRLRFQMLAGPNDAIQFIADLPGWVQIALAMGVLYGTELIKEAAKATWRNHSALLKVAKSGGESALGKIIQGLSWMASRKGATAVLGVRASNAQVAGIALPFPEDVVWSIAQMARHAETIKNHVESLIADGAALEQNPDMRSYRVILEDDGSITIPYRVKRPATDAQGRPSFTYEPKSIRIAPE